MILLASSRNVLQIHICHCTYINDDYLREARDGLYRKRYEVVMMIFEFQIKTFELICVLTTVKQNTLLITN
jgi:hypothetical protein